MKHVIPRFEGDYHFLSNFHPSIISFELRPDVVFDFPDGESLFQALKYQAMVIPGNLEQYEYVKSLANCKSPNEAKRLGRSVRIDTAKWDDIKNEAMRQTTYHKYLQHEDLRHRLLDTGAALLVEGNTWGDEYWGRCNGKGFNLLGSILMEVRGYFYWNGRRDPIG